MTPQQKTIKIFSSSAEAEAAIALLNSFGIDANVAKDDCGGMRPDLQLSQGVMLLVNEENVEEANEILNSKQMSILENTSAITITDDEENEFDEWKKKQNAYKIKGIFITRAFTFLGAAVFFCIALLPFEESEIIKLYFFKALCFASIFIFILTFIWGKNKT